MSSYLRQCVAVFVALWVSLLTPVSVIAQDAVDASGDPTGPTTSTGPQESTGAPSCTGAGCGQGANQGANQGAGQGGPSAADLGADENGVLPAGVEDTRQGANQGAAQGATNGVVAGNSNTGADSTNDVTHDTDSSTVVTDDNDVVDTTTADVAGTTGGNSQSRNTNADGLVTGDASVSATVVKTDNVATVGGEAGFTADSVAGDHTGDYTVSFGSDTAELTSAEGVNSSYQLINEATGSGSSNGIDVFSRLEDIVEVQNDGVIDNDLTIAADTGSNVASENTSDGVVETGDADVAVTLVNLLNTAVINGDLWVTVADIFGSLEGDIHIPDLAGFVSSTAASQTVVDVGNTTTGADSTNTIDVTVDDAETFTVDNEADITTTVDATANTGDNEAIGNTQGSEITTGDASVQASNVTVTNTTVEGGNWGLFVVNALNGFMGFLVGDNGSVQALSHDETIREIEAHNDTTGSDSDNSITVVDETERTTEVVNDATIINDITAAANTGGNTTSDNTGRGVIDTGDASVQASAINVANTTVKDGSLFIAVVNVFGEWYGDLLYNDTSLAQVAAAQAASEVVIDAVNEETGSDSTNEIDVAIDRTHDTIINNVADLEFVLDADVNTGGNTANRNTQGVSIETGDGLLAQYSRTVANTTGIAGDRGLTVEADFVNDTTGFDSENTIEATVNDERIIDVTNDADVTTVLGDAAPASVNTGGNEANQNTLGVVIDSGDIDADVAIENMVNHVILALTGEGVEVDADFENTLTGALSSNLNDLDVVQDTLATVLDDAVIDTIIDLLLNTGNNTANENTGGGLVYSGAGCVTGDLAHDANGVLGDDGISSTVTNVADITNDAEVAVRTGGNTVAGNTGVATGVSTAGTCGVLAQAEAIDFVGAAEATSDDEQAEEQDAVDVAESEEVTIDEDEEAAEIPAVQLAFVEDSEPVVAALESEVLQAPEVAARVAVVEDVGSDEEDSLMPAVIGSVDDGPSNSLPSSASSFTAPEISSWVILAWTTALLMAVAVYFDRRARHLPLAIETMVVT